MNRWSLFSDASVEAIPEPYREEFWREVAFTNVRRFRALAIITTFSYCALIYIVNILNSLKLSSADNRLVLMMHVGLLTVYLIMLVLFYGQPLRSPLDVTPYFTTLLKVAVLIAMLSTQAFCYVIVVTNGHPIFFFISAIVWSSSLLIPPRIALVLLMFMVVVIVNIMMLFLPSTENPRFVGETYIIAVAIPVLVIVSSSLLFRSTAESFRQRKAAEDEHHTVVRLNQELQQRQRILEEQAVEIEIMNTTLQEQNAELTLLNEEKDELMGIVAHDLKNPLSAIMNFSMMLEEDGEDLSIQERQEFTSHITKTSERMFELIKNLLDVNALERGGMNLHLVNVDVSVWAEQAIDQYRSAAAAKGIDIEYTGKPTMARTDEQALYQVLDNLVSNAVKYSPQGKRVFVRVSSTEIAARIAIQDEGPGISEDDMKRLFGKFARLSAQPTGGEHSTGLGLSIVKKMVEAMQGRVWCESELGKGATFIVELPAAL
jgi:signal transduction histidine kinase